MVDAVILAGADNDGRLAGYDAARYEALIDIAGKPMIHYVLRAVKTCSRIGRVAVVGPKKALEEAIPPGNAIMVERVGSIVDNLKAGIRSLDPQGKVLIVTADLPLLTPEALEDLFQKADASPADIHYPLLRKETNEARFPGMKRTYLTVAEGTFTGGNVILASPLGLEACGRLLEQAVATRKKPWMMAAFLGLRCTVKFILGRLSIHDVERRLQEIAGVRGVAIISEFPEIAVDVDKPSDLELVRRLVASPA
ncbi:MAG: nucleotidyltransferase family protein [Bacillota bacterium]